MGIIKRGLNIALIFLILILIGTFAYHQIEGWGYLDSVYFTVITVTTIGYGDLTPQTDIGKIFTMFFAVTGIAVAFYVISLMMRYIYMIECKRREKRDNRGIIKIRK